MWHPIIMRYYEIKWEILDFVASYGILFSDKPSWKADSWSCWPGFVNVEATKPGGLACQPLDFSHRVCSRSTALHDRHQVMKYLNSTPAGIPRDFDVSFHCLVRLVAGQDQDDPWFSPRAASVSSEASARALQRTRTVASRCLVHRDIGMAGGRTRVACVGMAGDDPLKSLIRQANVWISAGWASYLYPRNDQKWKCSCIYYYIIYNTPCNVCIYIYILWVHTYIFIIHVSHMFFSVCTHFTLPEIVTKRQQVILPHQEEEAFRKATEFVLLHSPQQGNLKEEAPLAGTVHRFTARTGAAFLLVAGVC